MKVKVTSEHIQDGIRNNSYRCPIANAIHAADPYARYVSVDLQSIRWSHMTTRVRYVALTPPGAQTFLLKFDNARSVEPFEFRATPVPGLQRKVGWTANHPGTEPRAGKKYKSTGRKIYRPRAHRGFGLHVLDPKDL